MDKQIDILGKPVNVTLSHAAVKALSGRNKPLIVEMELYFSCLIRKQVRFRENEDSEAVNVLDQLSVRFRPVMTKSCSMDSEGKDPPLTDFPIEKPEPFVPHWLKVDFKKNEWIGEFGF